MEPKLTILPKSQLNIWPQLGQIPSDFVLYGGTAIALRFGHRISVDFDFFSSRPLQGNKILELPLFENHTLLARTRNSLTLTVENPSPVKFQFFGELPLSRVGTPSLLPVPGIQVASPYDLFATKLKVIQDRGEKKDYLDIIEFIQQGYDLAKGIAAGVAVYRNNYNPSITLRAAVSFIDGDLPSLKKSERLILENAVAEFWSAKTKLPETNVLSTSLSAQQ